MRNQGGPGAPPSELLPMIKMSQKRLLFFSASVSFSIFIVLSQGARALSILFLPTNQNGPPAIIIKWAPNNNIDPGARAP